MEGKLVDFVEILPLELIEEIFLFLKPKDLAACTAVSSSWREAVNSNKIWGYLCDRNGWNDVFDPDFSHFSKSHKQFRKWAHSYNSFSTICHKRLLYNKHSCLRDNWRCGKYIVNKISSGAPNYMQLVEPVACNGKYLIVQEKSCKTGQITNLGVWSLNGIPTRLCHLSLPSKVHAVDTIAFEHDTIVVVQAWLIIVYQLKNGIFQKVHEIQDLDFLDPKLKLPMKRMVPFIKITNDTIVCVPSISHSTVDFIPIFFWDRMTGELKNSLGFDSMYYVIADAIWFDDSCYLNLTNKKKKTYQVVEFGVKTAAWESFSQSVTVEIEQIAVSNQYVLAVTKAPNPSPEYFLTRGDTNNKELWLWDRATGSAVKTFEAQGKTFQFVDDYLMYFDSSHVTVMKPKDPDICSEFGVSGTISSVRASPHSSIVVVIKTGCYIEVWDWGRGCRLYTITAETGYGNQLWCDDKRIITYHSSESSSSGGFLIIGFW